APMPTSATGFIRPLVPNLRRATHRPAHAREFAMTSRRDFIATVGLAAAGAALAPLAACSQELPDPASSAPRPKPVGAIADIVPAGALLMRTIPSSGEAIPAIGVGTSGSYAVPLDSAEVDALREVVRIFFEGGGRVIDISPN